MMLTWKLALGLFVAVIPLLLRGGRPVSPWISWPVVLALFAGLGWHLLK